MIEPSTQLIVFDADGTLRYVTVPGQHYPLRADEWRLMSGVSAKLATLSRALRFGIASNQHGVALGQLAHSDAEAMLRATWQAAWMGSPPELLIEMCVCLPNARCERRKPEPGMLRSLMARHGVAPSQTLYVGDLPIDEQAATRAGARFAWAHDFFAPADRVQA